MTRITIKASTAKLFSPELRSQLDRDLAPGNAAGVFATGDTLHVEGSDADDVRSNLTPHAWVFPEDASDIIRNNLYHAGQEIQKQAAAAYFATWGNADWNAAVDAKCLEMAEAKEGEPSFDVLCLSFGMLVLSSNPTLDMCLDAQDQGQEQITQAIADANIAVILDSSISAHESIEALARLQRFIDTMIARTLESRGDRDKWISFYEGVEIRIARGDQLG